MIALPTSLPNEYKTAIAHIVERLAQEYRPEKIILYGSCARGRVRPWSDIDMLIVKRSTSGRRIDRTREVSRLFPERRIPFEPLVLTPEELEARQQDLFISDILREGKELYAQG